MNRLHNICNWTFCSPVLGSWHCTRAYQPASLASLNCGTGTVLYDRGQLGSIWWKNGCPPPFYSLAKVTLCCIPRHICLEAFLKARSFPTNSKSVLSLVLKVWLESVLFKNQFINFQLVRLQVWTKLEALENSEDISSKQNKVHVRSPNKNKVYKHAFLELKRCFFLW